MEISMKTGGYKPVVGFLSYMAAQRNVEYPISSPYGRRLLADAGYRFGLGEARDFWDTENAETAYNTLRQFDVVFLDNPFDESINSIDPVKAAAAREGLERYLNDGGNAILLLQSTRYRSVDQEYSNEVYAGLGVQMLREGVFDETTQFTARLSDLEHFTHTSFFTTDAIYEHPFFKGVKNLCFPKYFEHMTPGALAAAYDHNWTILAYGGPGSRSYGEIDKELDTNIPGSYGGGEAPLAAVREYGAGLVMAVSVQARNTFMNYGKAAWNNIVELTGNASSGIPSDNTRLMMNAITFMTENSANHPKVGTFDFRDTGPVRFPAKWLAGEPKLPNRIPRGKGWG